MLGLGIRKAIKAQVKRLLGRGETSDAPVTPPRHETVTAKSTGVAPGDKSRPPRSYDTKVADELDPDGDHPQSHTHDHDHGHSHGHSHDHEQAPPMSAAPPRPITASPAAAAPVAPEPKDDVVGAPIMGVDRELTPEAVEAVLDEMVRPALQADGGDIAFVKIEANDVYVRLVGSCSSCPSSILTMKMGVERLLQEEFPEMGALVQVEDPPAA